MFENRLKTLGPQTVTAAVQRTQTWGLRNVWNFTCSRKHTLKGVTTSDCGARWCDVPGAERIKTTHSLPYGQEFCRSVLFVLVPRLGTRAELLLATEPSERKVLVFVRHNERWYKRWDTTLSPALPVNLREKSLRPVTRVCYSRVDVETVYSDTWSRTVTYCSPRVDLWPSRSGERTE